MDKANFANAFLTELFGSPDRALGSTFTARRQMNYHEEGLPPMIGRGAYFTIVGLPSPGLINIRFGDVWDTVPVDYLERLLALSPEKNLWKIKSKDNKIMRGACERARQWYLKEHEVLIPKFERVPIQ